MESFTFLFGVPGWLVGVLLFVVCVAASEIGYRLGAREIGRGGETREAKGLSKRDHLGAVQAVVAALLGLLLAFSVSMAVGRFEDRKAAVVDESNCIGTAYLRVSLLPEPQRTEAQPLFKQYTDVRLELARPDWFLEGASGLREKAFDLQRQIWTVGVEAARLDQRAVTTGLFVSSVNEMIDSAGRRDAGLKNHVPEPVVYIIFLVALACLGIVGYASGLTGGRSLTATLIIAAVVALVVFVILDFDRPYRGVITVSQQSLIDLRNSMDLGLPLP